MSAPRDSEMLGPKAAPLSEHRRMRVLDAAASCFGENGVGVSMETIAKSAGMTEQR